MRGDRTVGECETFSHFNGLIAAIADTWCGDKVMSHVDSDGNVGPELLGKHPAAKPPDLFVRSQRPEESDILQSVGLGNQASDFRNHANIPTHCRGRPQRRNSEKNLAQSGDRKEWDRPA